MNILKLQADCILHAPLLNYEKDFTFIVNEEKHETNKIIADLISPIISNRHKTDPTIDKFYITTKSKGNFQIIFDLFSFNDINVDDKELFFISEIFQQLGTEKIFIKKNPIEQKMENIFDLISEHEKFRFFDEDLKKDIEFLSSHFYEMNEQQEDQFINLSSMIIEKIFTDDHLKLDSEDQLLRIVNKLYSKNHQLSYFYEYVLFSYVNEKSIEFFLSNFDNDDMTRGMWLSLSKRLMSSHDIIRKHLKQSQINSSKFHIQARNLQEFSII